MWWRLNTILKTGQNESCYGGIAWWCIIEATISVQAVGTETNLPAIGKNAVCAHFRSRSQNQWKLVYMCLTHPACEILVCGTDCFCLYLVLCLTQTIIIATWKDIKSSICLICGVQIFGKNSVLVCKFFLQVQIFWVI